MIFWIIVAITAALTALFAKHKGFFPMWAISFNVMISIYLAFMLAPKIAVFMPPAVGSLPMSKSIIMLAIALIIFIIFYIPAVLYLIGTYSISIPALVESIGSIALGLLSGFLIGSFALMIITTLPAGLIPSQAADFIDSQLRDNAIKYVQKNCNFINAVSLQNSNGKKYVNSVKQWLLTTEQDDDKDQEKQQEKTKEPKPSEQNLPPEKSEPQTTQPTDPESQPPSTQDTGKIDPKPKTDPNITEDILF